ncbi:MAG: SH3 domain-containing protein [Bacilli bacterium]
MKKFLVCLFFCLLSFLFISDCQALEVARVINGAGLNVRTGPGTNYKLSDSLNYNDNVTVTNTSVIASRSGCLSGWYQINYKGYIRYVCSTGISFSNPTVHTTNKKTTLYASTSSNLNKIDVSKTAFTVIDSTKYKSNFCKSGLYKVNYDGYTKYVCSSNVSYYTTNSNVIVTSNTANIYSSITKKNIIGIAKYNQPFTLYSNKIYTYKNKQYYAIYYKGKKEYIEKANALNTKYNFVVTNKSGANIRSSASTKSKKLFTIKYGSAISIVGSSKYRGIGCNAGFYKIKLYKKYGYICSNLVSSSSITTYTNKTTNIYTSTNAKYRITSLENDQKIVVANLNKYEGYNCKDGYYKVNINQRTGYICSTYTKMQNEYATKIPVLTFHRIVSDELKQTKFLNDEWTHSYDVFTSQIEYLYDNGYKTINLDQFYCWYKGKCNFPKKTVVLTFDDGNLDDYYLVMPLLHKYGFKGTTFVVGSRTQEQESGPYNESERAFLSQDVIDKAKTEYPNHDFQSHSYNFHFYDNNGKQHVKNMTKDQIREDFELNKKYGFKYMAYPYGAYTKDLQDVAKESGILLGFRFSPSTYATRKSSQYAIPRIKINGFSNVDTMKKYLFY